MGSHSKRCQKIVIERRAIRRAEWKIVSNSWHYICQEKHGRFTNHQWLYTSKVKNGNRAKAHLTVPRRGLKAIEWPFSWSRQTRKEDNQDQA